MATLKDIRKRISSVHNTQKITKAMKMVSAAKLRRAQQAMVNARPYAHKMTEVVQRVVQEAGDIENPFLTARDPIRRIAIVVLASDRGLCGPFNGNLLRQVYHFYKIKMQEQEVVRDTTTGGGERDENVRLYAIGRKSLDFFRARRVPIHWNVTGVYEEMSYEYAGRLVRQWMGEYLQGEWDQLYLCYNAFVTAISQEVRMDCLFPLTPTSSHEDTIKQDQGGGGYIFEPKKGPLLDGLIPRYLATRLYQAFLESIASEYGARMAAMDAATNNCSELIRSLTLKMNRLRQASITRELIDIVNGAAAL
ncbi:MAG: ATP synthase F1 subunit gamma [Deltaproteobacteria bacterium RIFCSPLOWO2_02_FULL_50_16]|nr:MAG: ATP synthase F1 subunit gamma [Deltaproteobacteria bacterium GWA2_50_8]OGQ31876.1 MAG: ATP synthase F1 subunit gamma [Deltaproteobacteria bacterium RIFCSPHIGHO2_02_FULL_50_15]OGQ55423.1 MAG: ATP synthase F1 subunit gamma [Deltaproteobacteria bacterium RIFCSPLOWO2_02_FULL_50_16]OGQ66767.1 MAG: ATP synthase F1 subunit gamma [Deltaproteobacteria bacterium RIFCSPLOWO2_12_FULL_50_11]